MIFYNLANLLMRVAFRLLTRTEITGRENVPKEGSLVVAINHLNFLDGPVAGISVDRYIQWMSKVESWDNPILGTLMTLYGAFPIRRGEVDRKALGRALAVLKAGGALGVSPEGHRSGRAEMGRAKAGAARLALQTDAAILPIAIAGTEKAVHELLRLRRPRITIRIGEAFKFPPERPVSKDRQQELVDDIMLRIAAMLPESYRGVYANGRPGPEVRPYEPPELPPRTHRWWHPPL